MNKWVVFFLLFTIVAIRLFRFFFLPNKAYAGPDDPFQFLQVFESEAPDKDAGFDNVSDFLGVSLNILFGIALAVSVIYIIMSGIKFVTARGDPKAKALAKQALTYALVAFILAIGAYTVKLIIINVVGGDFGELKNATPTF